MVVEKKKKNRKKNLCLDFLELAQSCEEIGLITKT